MGYTQVRESSIWFKHVLGDRELTEALEGLQPSEVIKLRVGSHEGHWARMEDGTDGRRTFGIKPQADAKKIWAELQARRGHVVTIEKV